MFFHNREEAVSEPIKIGDLVVVVRPAPCCGKSDRLGHFYTVIDGPRTEFVRCECGSRRPNTNSVTLDDPNESSCQVFRLKRIPPFPELKDERHDEEIEA